MLKHIFFINDIEYVEYNDKYDDGVYDDEGYEEMW